MRLDDIKIAFIDLDGVLSVPRYENRYNTSLSCSMPDDLWFARCNTSLSVYDHCVAPDYIRPLLDELKARRVKLYVLTHETNSGAYFNKVNFVLNHYSEYFDSYRKVLFTSCKEGKIDLMEAIRSKYDVGQSKCLLVEDTFETCHRANMRGFTVMHISELFLRESEKLNEHN
jgi:glycosyltransferase involved in cell wall biosynthesis